KIECHLPSSLFHRPDDDIHARSTPKTRFECYISIQSLPCPLTTTQTVSHPSTRHRPLLARLPQALFRPRAQVLDAQSRGREHLAPLRCRPSLGPSCAHPSAPRSPNALFPPLLRPYLPLSAGRGQPLHPLLPPLSPHARPRALVGSADAPRARRNDAALPKAPATSRCSHTALSCSRSCGSCSVLACSRRWRGGGGYGRRGRWRGLGSRGVRLRISWWWGFGGW
ncbi:hypothetical protein B0H13DRAFT_2426390, partial [Mycena leptocephala]